MNWEWTVLFGEYLVEKRIISQESLLAALIEQLAGAPQHCEVIYRYELMSTKDLINVLSYQSRNGLDFVKASQELGVWTDKIQEVVEDELKKNRVPLGHILVMHGNVNSAVLTKALDEFLKSSETQNQELASEPVFMDIEKEVLTDYFDLLSKELNSHLAEIAQAVRLNAEQGANEKDIQKNVKKMKEVFEIILHSARFARAELTAKIVSQLVLVLDRLESHSELSKLVLEISDISENIIKIVWAIRGSLLDSGTEEYFWGMDTSKEAYEKSMQELKKWQERLSK